MTSTATIQILQQQWTIITDAIRSFNTNNNNRNNNNNSNSDNIVTEWSKRFISILQVALQNLEKILDKSDCRSVVRVVSDIVALAANNPDTVLEIDRCNDLVKFVLETLVSLERAIFASSLRQDQQQQQQVQQQGDSNSGNDGDGGGGCAGASVGGVVAAGGGLMIDETNGYTTLALTMEGARDVLEDFLVPSDCCGGEGDEKDQTTSVETAKWKQYFETMSGLRSRDFDDAKRKIKSIMPIVRTSLGLCDDDEGGRNEASKVNVAGACGVDEAPTSKRQETIDRLRSKLRDRYQEEFIEIYGSKAVKLGSVFVTLRIQNTTTTTTTINNNNNNYNNNNIQQQQTTSKSTTGTLVETEGEIVSGSSLPDRVSQVIHGNKSVSPSTSPSPNTQSSTSANKSVVLVEGPAGIGKTCLCQQLCIEQGFKDALLIFVPLKNLHGIRIEDVATLLSCCASGVLRGDEMEVICNNSNNSNNNTHTDSSNENRNNNNIHKQIGRGGGEERENDERIPVMWFLDGFDEVQHTTDPHLANFLKHFVDPRTRALHSGDPKYRNLVRDCDLVVVSSREERSSDAKSGCNLEAGNVERWVIMRWTDSEVRQYCTKWFSNVLLFSSCSFSQISASASSQSSALDDRVTKFTATSANNNYHNNNNNNNNTDQASGGATSSSFPGLAPSSSPASAAAAISNMVQDATDAVVDALRSNHMEYFAGLPLIVHMLCEIRLERGDLSHITPSTAFEEMSRLHWNRAKKRIRDRLLRMNHKQQLGLNLLQIFKQKQQQQQQQQQRTYQQQANSTTSRRNLFFASPSSTQANDDDDNDEYFDEDFAALYNFVIASAAEAGYQQLVDSSREDVTSLFFVENSSSSSSFSGSFSDSSSKLPLWATLLRETGLLKLSASTPSSGSFESSPTKTAAMTMMMMVTTTKTTTTKSPSLIATSIVGAKIRRGRFPHRSYIEFLCARHAANFPAQCLSQVENVDTILWTPKFATVWLLLADFVVNHNYYQYLYDNNKNKNKANNSCNSPSSSSSSFLKLDQLAAQIALLYTRTYEKLVDRKNTSTVESNISHATAEVIGVPLLLRLSMIFASSSSSSLSSFSLFPPSTGPSSSPSPVITTTITNSGSAIGNNPGVDLLFSAIKKKHGLHGFTLRMPRHFLWAAEYSGSVGAIDAFKWIRNTYGSDVINADIASAALSRALDRQDRPSVANFVKVLVDPPFSIPVTLASAVKVGSLAGVTRALEQGDDDHEEDLQQQNNQLQQQQHACVVKQAFAAFCPPGSNHPDVGCAAAHQQCGRGGCPTLCPRPPIEVEQDQKVKWRNYLAKCLRNNWHDVTAAMFRLRPDEWRSILLYHQSTALMSYIANEIIPQEIQVWDKSTNCAVTRKKKDVLLPQLQLINNTNLTSTTNSSSEAKIDQEIVFNCDDTLLPNQDEIPDIANKNYRDFTFTAFDSLPEYDSLRIFLNNNNGWLGMIAALLMHACTFSSPNSAPTTATLNETAIDNGSDNVSEKKEQEGEGAAEKKASTSPNIFDPKRITKLELCPKTVALIPFSQEEKGDDDGNDGNDQREEKKQDHNKSRNFLSENQWKEHLVVGDAKFVSNDPDVLAKMFTKDVRIRRLTFSASSTASASLASTSPLLLRHFDISHVDVQSALQAGIDDTFASCVFKNAPLLEYVDVSFTGGVITDASLKELFIAKKTTTSAAPLKFLNVSSTAGAITDQAFTPFGSSSTSSLSSSCAIFSHLESFKFALGKGKITDTALFVILRQQEKNLVLADIDCRASDAKVTDNFILEYVKLCTTSANTSSSSGSSSSNRSRSTSSPPQAPSSSSSSPNCPLRSLAVASGLVTFEGMFNVTSAFIHGNSAITDAALPQLLRIASKLELLDVSFTAARITNKSISEIASTNLTWLNVSGTGMSITDASLEGVVANSPRLRFLDVSWTGTCPNDKLMKALATNECRHSLTSLNYNMCTGASEAGMELLVTNCTKLKLLNIRSNGGNFSDNLLLTLAKSENKDLRIVNALLTAGLISSKSVLALKESNPLTVVKVSSFHQ